MLNFHSTGMYVTVNFKWKARKKWTSSAKLIILVQCRYTEIAHRIFKHSDIQYTSVTPDKILNSSVYRTLFYVNIYGSFKLSKNSPVFGAPCTIRYDTRAQFGRQSFSVAAPVVWNPLSTGLRSASISRKQFGDWLKTVKTHLFLQA